MNNLYVTKTFHKIVFDITLRQSLEFFLIKERTIFNYIQDFFENNSMSGKMPRLYSHYFSKNEYSNAVELKIEYFFELKADKYFSIPQFFNFDSLTRCLRSEFENIYSINYECLKVDDFIKDSYIYGFSYKMFKSAEMRIDHRLKLNFYQFVMEDNEEGFIVRFNDYSFRDWLFLYAINAVACSDKKLFEMFTNKETFKHLSYSLSEDGDGELRLYQKIDDFIPQITQISENIKLDKFDFSDKIFTDDEKDFLKFFRPFFPKKTSSKTKVVFLGI